MRDVQSWDVKGVPQLEVMCSGTPEQLLHPERRADTQEEEDASAIETAFNQCVDLFMVMMRYLDPSRWMCPNLRE